MQTGARPARLIAMANQIAGFFRSYPDEEAMAGIEKHVVSFWTPAMRARLDRWIDAGAEGLDPLARLALRRDADAESPVQRVTSPAREAGPLATDAG